MAKNNQKIVLGTAQIGMDYGFCKNKLYKSKKNIFKILDYAKKKISITSIQQDLITFLSKI